MPKKIINPECICPRCNFIYQTHQKDHTLQGVISSPEKFCQFQKANLKLK